MGWILFVEDNEDLRHIVTELLRIEGYKVQSAADGEEALALLARRAPPLLIITDLHMPVMNGWELIEHVRADLRLAHVPIVVASSEEVPVPGIEHHLTKPYQMEELLRLVRHHVPARRATG